MNLSRGSLLLPIAVLAACSGGGGGGGTQPPPGFQLRTADLVIPAGEEVAYCSYFHTPNTAELVASRLDARLPPIARSMMVLFTATDLQPPGTQTSTGCGWAPASGQVPVYTTTDAAGTLTFPADDGTGKPIGLQVPANQPGYFWVHYANASAQPVTVHVEWDVTGYPAGTSATLASSFVTLDTALSIPPNGSTTAETTCAVPSGAKLLSVTTRTFKHSVHTEVRDGTAVLFQSNDWTSPGEASWTRAPFFSFASGALTASCDFVNPTAQTITFGDDPTQDETCAAVSFYFPATRGRLCVNGTLLP